ncbi:MAG: S8 family serine peptidase [Clostridia bacterium]|nr:S8 family serine peptidase [Clostridia bacterium]
MKIRQRTVVFATLLLYLLSIVVMPLSVILGAGGIFEFFKTNDNTLSDDNDTSVVIFALNQNCMMDLYHQSGSTLSYADYLNTSLGKTQRQQLVAKTKELQKTIDFFGGKSRNTYVDLTVGVSASVKNKDIETICRATGSVAYDNVTYSTASSQDTATTSSIAQNSITPQNSPQHNQGVYVNDTPYQGEGALVAVLDSGFNVNHDCFKPLSNDKNPTLTTTKVQAIWESNSLSVKELQETKGHDYQDVYVNTKIPYAFDYANKDFDVMPTSSSHGMHVAGMIVGNDSQTVVGSIPNSQVALMKIFDDRGVGASTEVIMSALGDCAVLGADVVNLSLGITSGMSKEYAEENNFVNKCMLKLYEAGVVVCSAAGNDYYSGYLSNLGGTSSKHPDNGLISSTASYLSAFAVGSVNSVPQQYLTIDGKNTIFTTNFVDQDKNEYDFTNLIYANGTKQTVSYEYVYVGLGRPENYVGKEVTGKMVLVDRGFENFTVKHNVAREHGAVGMLLLNNEYTDAYFMMDTAEINYPNTTPIPSLIVNVMDRDLFDKQNGGTVVFSQQNECYLMSDFSTWGPNPDLSIKPEIVAYGGKVLSASINFNDVSDTSFVEYKSGTSMATPNISGLTVAVKQYLKTLDKYKNATDRELALVIQNLLSTTATPLRYPDGSIISVRHQGSGLADLNGAINANAYMMAFDSGKSKLELGDDPKKVGKYNLDVLLHNLTQQAKTYTVSVEVFTATITQDDKVMTLNTFALDFDAVTLVEGQQTNTFTANFDTTRIKVAITLKDSAKQYLDRYPNGIYVEGYLTLTDQQGNQLSLPYLAFYGDWQQVPFMDTSAIDGDETIYASSPMILDQNGRILGKNLVDIDEDAPTDFDKLALSLLDTNEQRDSIVGLNVPTTRTLKKISVYMLDNQGKQVGTKYRLNSTGKNYYLSVYERLNFSFCTKDYKTLKAGDWLKLVVVPETEYGNANSNTIVTFDVYIDGFAPDIDKNSTYLYSKDDKIYLKTFVKEDFYLMYFLLQVGSKVIYLPITNQISDDYQVFDLDVSNYFVDTTQSFSLVAYDYALNVSNGVQIGG